MKGTDTRRFLDTNVLLYSISTDPKEREKRARAIDLLDQDDCSLSVQVLQEFYVQATRPTRPQPISHSLACAMMKTWLRFQIQQMTLPLLFHALDIKGRYGFSYWDCAIIAAAHAQGCKELYSEDLSEGQIVEGVQIVNPFR